VKSDRLLSVLLLLQAKGRATERELAERLEVSQRTIHRDLEALSAARVPVVALRGAQGGWELDKGWRTQVPGLDESELQALLMVQPRALGHPRLRAAAESALNKLMAALPGPLREQAAAARERLHIDPAGWWDTGEDLSVLPLVQDAVARERRLSFDYVRADGEKSARTADPLGLVAKGTSWYLVADTAKGMRTFRISRMEGVTVLATGFKRPARFDLAEYWSRSTESLQRQRGGFPVILLLTEDAARRLSIHCKVAPQKEKQAMADPGWTAVRAEFDSLEQARFVVMGLGARACVLEPPELQRLIRSEVAELAATMF
jgi:predicted DNA-binding transcriptional regulator YafY